MRVSTAFFQLGGMVEPETCRKEPDSPILASMRAVVSVSIGSRRPLAMVRELPSSSSAPRTVAVPSLSRTFEGPSTRRVLSGLSLNCGKLLPPREDYSIWLAHPFPRMADLGLDKLGTGVNGLDKLLRGGFPLGKTSLVYGEASTGKTVLTMQTALQASARGFKVFFVDCDLSFSVQRLESLDHGKELAENIVLFQPENFREQTRVLEGLEVLLSKTPALLIIDSITGLYRADLDEQGAAFGQSRELNRQLAFISDLSTRSGLSVLLTGQVHSQPVFGEWLIAPVAMRTLRHWSFLILRLKPTPRQDVRECLLEKIDGREAKGPRAIFRIGETGLSDV